MHLPSLLLAAATLANVLAAPAPNADPAPNERSVSKNKKRSNFWFAGVNESGAEFGSGNIPGTLGTDYTWPLTSSVDTLMGKGFNIFRIPFLMERLVPNSLTGSVNSAYLSEMQSLVSHITGKGGYAAICAQNFGRYYGSVITDTNGFESFWKTVASVSRNPKSPIALPFPSIPAPKMSSLLVHPCFFQHVSSLRYIEIDQLIRSRTLNPMGR